MPDKKYNIFNSTSQILHEIKQKKIFNYLEVHPTNLRILPGVQRHILLHFPKVFHGLCGMVGLYRSIVNILQDIP